MNHQEKSKIQQEIEDNNNKIILLEKCVIEKEKEIQNLKTELKKDLLNLSVLHKKQNLLTNEFIYQKDNEDKSLLTKTKHITNLFKHPLIDKIKQNTLKQTHDIKNYLKSLDNEKMETKYLQYKQFCVDTGEKIKTREEFKKLINSIETVRSEAQELNLYDILSKLTEDAVQASTAVNKAIKDSKNNKEISKKSISEHNLLEHMNYDKYALFLQWVKQTPLDITNINDALYNDYIKFLKQSCPPMSLEAISYNKRYGSFKKIVNKYINCTHKN